MALVRLSRRPPLVPLDGLMSKLAELERRLAADGTARSESPSPKVGAGRDPAKPPNELPSEPLAQSPRDLTTSVDERTQYASTVLRRHGVDSNAEVPGFGTSSAQPSALERSVPERDKAHAVTWRAILDRIATEAPLASSMLEHGVLQHDVDGRIAVGFEAGSFALSQIKDEMLRTASRVATDVRGTATEVTVVTVSTLEASSSVAAARSAEKQEELDAARRRIASNPIVIAALSCLKAELRDVRVTSSD